MGYKTLPSGAYLGLEIWFLDLVTIEWVFILVVIEGELVEAMGRDVTCNRANFYRGRGISRHWCWSMCGEWGRGSTGWVLRALVRWWWYWQSRIIDWKEWRSIGTYMC
jgi:hypothetical protein